MAGDRPFFSVIIPTFNRRHTLHKPINSVLGQSFNDWELIIVDDGSSDGTEEIMQQWNDSRISYVKQSNQERSVARNTGIALSKGQYVCFQDSDDEYLPNHLQVLYDSITSHPAYRMYRTGMMYISNGIQVRKSDFKTSRYFSYPYDCLPLWTIKREVLTKHTFDPSLKNGEDLEFILRICEDQSPYVIQEWTGIYHYAAETSGGVGPNYLNHMQNRIRALEKILHSHNTKILPYLIRQRCLCTLIILIGQTKPFTIEIFKHTKDTFRVFLRFPSEFLRLLMKIAYVKFGEISGLYSTKYRF